MGEAALAREFAKNPPQEPLTSITALWHDYMRRYVAGQRGDPSQPFTAKSKDIFQAIQRACDSKGEDGKTFFHQGRVWPVNREALAKKMIQDAKDFHWYEESEYGGSFDKLYEYVSMVGTETKGIGIVTIYDVCSRIAGYLELEPEHLYFHAGVTEGLRALGVEPPSGVDRIPRDQLPEFFHDKDLDLVESMLCGYRSQIELVMQPWLRKFWKNVDYKKRKPDECWPWIGKTRKSTGVERERGYFYLPRAARWEGEATKTPNASRVAFMTLFGSPGKSLVLHTCGNGNCMNYGHLYSGSSGDNCVDRDEHNRTARGSSRKNSKLNNAEVRSIRRRYSNQTRKALADEYGVSTTVIWKVAHREDWAHVK